MRGPEFAQLDPRWNGAAFFIAYTSARLNANGAWVAYPRESPRASARSYNGHVTANTYFDLTRTFNAGGPIAALASGQAVVYYRVAIMSKDGDWVIRETAEACARVLDILAGRGASYRPGAPLDTRWLAGGWSSHFEFADEKRRRVRCDFFSRPPRVVPETTDRLFASAADPLLVVDLESLIRMKRTQRAKDYAVIGELAARLPPAQEILLTTDPDRLMQLAPEYGAGVTRPAVEAALAGDRDALVVALAREQDRLQRVDRARLTAYAAAAEPYLEAMTRIPADERRLPAALERVNALAERLLPFTVDLPEEPDGDAQ
ncbi:hypothetical protein BH24ACI5_BH24ACI5_23300 [soil metagenome]